MNGRDARAKKIHTSHTYACNTKGNVEIEQLIWGKREMETELSQKLF